MLSAAEGSGEPAPKKSMKDVLRTGAKKALLDWTRNAIGR